MEEIERTDNVFYSPDKNIIIDFVMSDGRSEVERETLKEIRLRHPDAIITEWEQAHTAREDSFKIAPIRISKERWTRALEILPPARWHNDGMCESFKMSELTCGSITAIYVRIADRYYTFQDSFLLTHSQCVERCNAVR